MFALYLIHRFVRFSLARVYGSFAHVCTHHLTIIRAKDYVQKYAFVKEFASIVVTMETDENKNPYFEGGVAATLSVSRLATKERHSRATLAGRTGVQYRRSAIWINAY